MSKLGQEYSDITTFEIAEGLVEVYVDLVLFFVIYMCVLQSSVVHVYHHDAPNQCISQLRTPIACRSRLQFANVLNIVISLHHITLLRHSFIPPPDNVTRHHAQHFPHPLFLNWQFLELDRVSNVVCDCHLL